jgi:hypothetical protein
MSDEILRTVSEAVTTLALTQPRVTLELREFGNALWPNRSSVPADRKQRAMLWRCLQRLAEAGKIAITGLQYERNSGAQLDGSQIPVAVGVSVL